MPGTWYRPAAGIHGPCPCFGEPPLFDQRLEMLPGGLDGVETESRLHLPHGGGNPQETVAYELKYPLRVCPDGVRPITDLLFGNTFKTKQMSVYSIYCTNV